jgi:hypothetical protein
MSVQQVQLTGKRNHIGGFTIQILAVRSAKPKKVEHALKAHVKQDCLLTLYALSIDTCRCHHRGQVLQRAPMAAESSRSPPPRSSIGKASSEAKQFSWYAGLPLTRRNTTVHRGFLPCVRPRVANLILCVTCSALLNVVMPEAIQPQ